MSFGLDSGKSFYVYEKKNYINLVNTVSGDSQNLSKSMEIFFEINGKDVRYEEGKLNFTSMAEVQLTAFSAHTIWLKVISGVTLRARLV